MNESNDRPGQDSIATSIGSAADAIIVPDPGEMRRRVQSTFERRRRHRRTALGGVVGATALVAGLVAVAVNGDDGPGDRLVSAPVASAPEPDDEVNVADASDQAAGEGGTTGDAAPATTASFPSTDSIRVTGASSQEVSDEVGTGVDGGGVELFAWNDGFLTVRRSSEPQALPAELPEELAAAFPQEVLDLFPDGLPDTLEEATVVLQEAGLYDVVSDIVLSNDEVRDAIYAEQPELVTSVRFSADGVDWTDVDADLPTSDNGYPVRQLVSDDRFVIVTEPAYDSVEYGRFYDVHVSTDLLDWDVQRLVLPERVERRGLQYHVQIDGFAAGDTGWVASVSTYADVDVAGLLPDDVADEVRSGPVASGYDNDGVYVERYDDDGGTAERVEYTWAELGLEGPPDAGREPGSVGFFGEWGGIPQEIAMPGLVRGIERFGDGFVEFGDRLRSSPNGIDWTDVALPVDGSVSWVLDTAGGLLVSTDTRNGSEHHLLDPQTMTWTPVELPGVPSGAQIESPPGGDAILLADYGEPDFVQPATIRVSAESDGYALTFVLDVSSSETGEVSYEVRDVASGDVIVSESADGFEDPDAFEYLGGFETGEFVVDDPDTGELLVSFAESEIAQESLDENGDVLAEPDVEALESTAVHWVVAAMPDGLLVEEVSADAEWLSGAAVQGDTVLVALGDGSFVRLTSQ